MAESLLTLVEQNPTFKENLDARTYELFLDVSKEYDISSGIPFPFLLIEWACENKAYLGKRNGDLRTNYQAFMSKGTTGYANLYKVLAFAVFGYGCWSNNDRSRKGLSSIRLESLRRTAKPKQQAPLDR